MYTAKTEKQGPPLQLFDRPRNSISVLYFSIVSMTNAYVACEYLMLISTTALPPSSVLHFQYPSSH